MSIRPKFVNIMSAFSATTYRTTGSRQDIKNVDIPYPHSEILRIPILRDKSFNKKTLFFLSC